MSDLRAILSGNLARHGTHESGTRGRGRAMLQGGVGGPADAQSRVDANQLTRPAYRFTAQIMEPTGNRLGPGHPLFDPNSIGFWRLLFAALALAYVVGFHVTLGSVKLGLGPK